MLYRSHIIRNPARLRTLISAPEFVRLFGEPKPHPKGARQNIFGEEDELKTAPKGVDKNHRSVSIYLLTAFCDMAKKNCTEARNLHAGTLTY